MDAPAPIVETTVGSSTNDAETREQPRPFGQRRRGGGDRRRFSDNQGGGRRGARRDEGGAPGRSSEGNNSRGEWVWDRFEERVQQMAGPTFDLPPVDCAEKKFGGRSRLYVGNIGNDATDDDISKLFEEYGEVCEVFVNKEKNFAFIKFDYHANAVRAKRELDGSSFKQRSIKVRFSPSTTAIKIKNLTPYVTNELLHYAFSIFGEVERATVLCDEKGKPTGEGIVEFVKKGSATYALKKCKDECFFLTSSLRPIVVEAYEMVEDPDGFSERHINRKGPDFMAHREIGPRFAFRGSFEQKYGMKWKALYELQAQKEGALKREFELEKEKLEAQMEYEKYEHETEVLREQLRARELDKERQKREWELKERHADQEKRRYDEHLRRQQESLIRRQQDDVLRLEQENSLFAQAHNLDSILDQQEHAFEGTSFAQAQTSSGYCGSSQDSISSFASGYDQSRGAGGDGNMHWTKPRAGGESAQQEAFATKRARRF